jgi:hypothetical protein
MKIKYTIGDNTNVTWTKAIPSENFHVVEVIREDEYGEEVFALCPNIDRAQEMVKAMNSLTAEVK